MVKSLHLSNTLTSCSIFVVWQMTPVGSAPRNRVRYHMWSIYVASQSNPLMLLSSHCISMTILQQKASICVLLSSDTSLHQFVYEFLRQLLCAIYAMACSKRKMTRLGLRLLPGVQRLVTSQFDSCSLVLLRAVDSPVLYPYYCSVVGH